MKDERIVVKRYRIFNPNSDVKPLLFGPSGERIIPRKVVGFKKPKERYEQA